MVKYLDNSDEEAEGGGQKPFEDQTTQQAPTGEPSAAGASNPESSVAGSSDAAPSVAEPTDIWPSTADPSVAGPSAVQPFPAWPSGITEDDAALIIHLGAAAKFLKTSGLSLDDPRARSFLNLAAVADEMETGLAEEAMQQRSEPQRPRSAPKQEKRKWYERPYYLPEETDDEDEEPKKRRQSK